MLVWIYPMGQCKHTLGSVLDDFQVSRQAIEGYIDVYRNRDSQVSQLGW